MSIRYGLLGLLRRASTHGYQLRTDFEAATGATWPLNIGQVYSTLGRLERDGLIVGDDVDQDGGVERRRYQLTELGNEDLDRWFATPVGRESPPRSELVIKVVLAMMLPEVDARSVIDVQRAATMSSLQALTRVKLAAGDDLGASLAADAAVFNAEAEIRWLDYCEARLVRSTKGVTS